MNTEQFNTLIEKLEEIRCGLIDLERIPEPSPKESIPCSTCQDGPVGVRDLCIGYCRMKDDSFPLYKKKEPKPKTLTICGGEIGKVFSPTVTVPLDYCNLDEGYLSHTVELPGVGIVVHFRLDLKGGAL